MKLSGIFFFFFIFPFHSNSLTLFFFFFVLFFFPVEIKKIFLNVVSIYFKSAGHMLSFQLRDISNVLAQS